MDGDGARGRDGRGEDMARPGDGARPLGSGCRTGAPVAAQEKRAPLSLRSSVEHMVCHVRGNHVETCIIVWSIAFLMKHPMIAPHDSLISPCSIEIPLVTS